MNLVHILLVVFMYSMNFHGKALVKVQLTSNVGQQEELVMKKSPEKSTVTSVLYQLQINNVGNGNLMTNFDVWYIILWDDKSWLIMQADDFFTGGYSRC